METQRSTVSRDWNYPVDVEAEKAITEAFQKFWREDRSLGYVTEDQGLKLPPKTSPQEIEYMVEIDPVDGSRRAKSNFQGATVTLTFSRHQDLRSYFRDIELGLILDLTGDKTLCLATLDEVKIKEGNSFDNLELSQQSSPLRVLWSLDYSFPLDYLGIALRPLRDTCDYMEIAPCSAFPLLALARGQIDIFADLRRRLYDDFPQIHSEFSENRVFSYPYDFAGGYFILKNLGATVTDAYGKPLDDYPLWKFRKDGSWDPVCQLALVAARNGALHRQAIAKIEEGFENLKKSLNR